MGLLAVILIIAVTVAVVVLMHYECLYRLTVLMPKLRIRYRYRLVLGVFGALLAHVMEIVVFAVAYFQMHVHENLGYLEGPFDITRADCLYFSFTTYTTLGVGDIQPFGGIRYLSGVESLTGLLLITWTASFLFIEMQRYWVSR